MSEKKVWIDYEELVRGGIKIEHVCTKRIYFEFKIRNKEISEFFLEF